MNNTPEQPYWRCVMRVLLFIMTMFLTISACYAGDAQSVYDRVTGSGILRCGYFVEPPFTVKDPNNGKLSGFTFDLVEAIATDLGLKVEWTQEVDSNTMVEDILVGKYDITCASVWVIPERIKVVDHSQPYAFVNAYVYVRADETRIKGVEDLNNAALKISYTDGDAVGRLVKRRFPEAGLFALPTFAVGEYLNAVATHKADATVVIASVFKDFDKSNPGKMKVLQGDAPVFVIPNAFMFKRGEVEFKSMIDAMISLMVANGTYDALVRKYDLKGASIMPLRKPY